jgi:hypothetical protein
MANSFHCLTRCRSPLACGSFGYCRERNLDGRRMSPAEIERRKQESDAERVHVLQAGRAS